YGRPEQRRRRSIQKPACRPELRCPRQYRFACSAGLRQARLIGPLRRTREPGNMRREWRYERKPNQNTARRAIPRWISGHGATTYVQMTALQMTALSWRRQNTPLLLHSLKTILYWCGSTKKFQRLTEAPLGCNRVCAA